MNQHVLLFNLYQIKMDYDKCAICEEEILKKVLLVFAMPVKKDMMNSFSQLVRKCINHVEIHI